jgi:UDP-N-acetylglucosamine--N-acetylmuramyl-(pentapeptide) pyrophosphoryl-undecaprenol N-acetylglucosamine transferase
MEKELVLREGIPFESIPAAGVHGVGLSALPGNLNQIRRGYIAARRILKSFRPEVVFYTGGFIGVPMALASQTANKPRPSSLVYVPDIEPGMALKFLSRFSDKIALTTPQSSQYFSNVSRLVVTGYPTRTQLASWTKTEARNLFNLSPNLPTLLVVGGSKGARSINRGLMSVLHDLLTEIQIIHVSGNLDWEEIKSNANSLSTDQKERYRIFPYLHEQIGAALRAADLVVARAGASTLGEFPLFGLPAILVPYPYAWRYQKVNAEYLVNKGAAVLLPDDQLNQHLLSAIRSIIFDQNRQETMRQAMLSLAVPDAANRIADEVLSLAQNQGRGG